MSKLAYALFASLTAAIIALDAVGSATLAHSRHIPAPTAPPVSVQAAPSPAAREPGGRHLAAELSHRPRMAQG